MYEPYVIDKARQDEIDGLLEEIKKNGKTIHFIGIGGSGMCPIAEILHSRGYKLSGSDNNETETLNRVRKLGIPVFFGQCEENITKRDDDVGMIIYTAALLPTNPELIAAKSSGIPCYQRAILLGALSRKYGNCVGVCGTHGKTTTTSMITQMMLEAGNDVSAVIGGKLPFIDAYGKAGEDDTIVIESCEFKDTFLELSPSVAVILNIDADHLDYFGNIDNLKASFSRFAVSARNAVVYNGDDEKTCDAIVSVKEKLEGKQLITFGNSADNDWYPENIIENKSYCSFDVMHGSEKAGHITLSVPGRHNILNSLAAVAVADIYGLDLASAEKGISAFAGAGRRFEKLAEINGITVVDDYAHHPQELCVTLEAAMKMGYKTVWAVFQPFTFSRTSTLLDDFGEVLQIPDKIVLTEIMPGREVNTFGICTKMLADKIPGCIYIPCNDETEDYHCPAYFGRIAEFLKENAKPGDLVITLGCGDAIKISRKLISLLSEKD